MSISAGKIVAALELDTGNFTQRLQQAKTQADGIGGRLKGYGEGLASLGKGLTLGVTAPITALGAGIVKTSMDFEAGMSKVQAISSASAEDMEKLEAKAKEMGASTKFSATESSEALSYMAMAGWKTKEMLDGLPGVMNLAAASGENLGTVSDIVTDAISAFGLKASDSARFADVLAQASSNANTNVSMLGESFKYVGPVAGSLGYSIEDTSLALGLMANAGVKASQAGTTLRAALLRLSNPTEDGSLVMNEFGISMFNSDGTARSLRDVLKNLRQAFSEMSPEVQSYAGKVLFGQEAVAGMLAVLNTSDEEFNKFAKTLDNSGGAAERMAKTMENNVKGQLTLLKSNMEGVSLQLGKTLLPIINDGIKWVNELVTKFSKLSPETQKTIVKFAALAAATGPLLSVGGNLLKVGGSAIGLFGKLGGGIMQLAGGAGQAAGALGSAGLAGGLGASLAAAAPWVLGIGATVAAGYGLYKVLSSDTIPALKLFDDSMSEATKNGITSFLELEKSVNTSLSMAFAAGKDLTDEMKDNVVNSVTEMKEQIVTKMNEQKEAQLSSLREMLENSKNITEEEKQAIIKNAEESYKEKEKVYNDGVKRIEEIWNNAKKEHREITKSERKEINDIVEGMKKDGIRVLTESEQEYAVIRQRMKDQAGRITAEQVADLVKKSLEQKAKTIKAAEEEYDKRIKLAEQIRSEGTEKAKETAEKIIEEAKKQRDDTIKAAKEMHEKVVEEAKKQSGEHIKEIDFETGEIKKFWGRLQDWFNKNPIVSKIKTLFEGETPFEPKGPKPTPFDPNLKPRKQYRIPRYPMHALGTDYFQGGLTWVGERGAELVELPRGTRINSSGGSESRLSSLTREVKHTGEITIKGVSNSGELVAVKKLLLDEMRREARVYV